MSNSGRMLDRIRKIVYIGINQNEKEFPMPTKLTGTPINIGHGFKIYVGKPSNPKKGKPRIWISIRQDDPKEWRTYESLIYPHGADIQFVKK